MPIHRQAPIVLVAHLAQGLVARHIRRKAPQVLVDAQAFHCLDEVGHVVLPAEPAAVAGVQVHRHRRRRLANAHHGVPDALRVRLHRRAVATTRVRAVRGKVRQGVGLDDEDDGHLAVVLLQDPDDLVDVLGLVLGNAALAHARRGVVAPAVGQVSAADLAVRGLGVAIPVGQVVDDEGNELRVRPGGRVLQDALHALRPVALDLRLDVEPIGRWHHLHGPEGLGHDAFGTGQGGVQRGGVGGVHIIRHVLEGVALGSQRTRHGRGVDLSALGAHGGHRGHERYRSQRRCCEDRP
mmetsp:Transcript_103178/g.297134  ORF Transcript_103178/g.297134 Transcript_103178/m.297134 type:complete len:295 (+) Transcript_103178:801-1685(+)